MQIVLYFKYILRFAIDLIFLITRHVFINISKNLFLFKTHPFSDRINKNLYTYTIPRIQLLLIYYY